MKGLRILLLAVAGVLIVTGVAWAAPGTGMTGTAHDFSNKATTAVGLCTFCHTPHRAAQTRLLWNHKLTENKFSWQDVTATANGTPMPTFDKAWQGTSKNCLSCHDGSLAIGDILWFNKQANQNLLNEKHDNDDYTVGLGGNMTGNHPVAHPFPYNGAVSTYNKVTSGAQVLASGWQNDPSTFGIRLFNDDGAGNVSAGAVAGKTGIECASCHDPHNGPTVKDSYFLRGKLTGTGPASADSYICIKCHNK
jgi:hypothetical protein